MTKFWKIKNEVSSKGNELILDGVISSESWYEDEVTPKLFRDELNALRGDMTVRINSPGGDVYAGVAIYNALREYDGQVTVLVDGVAASIASIIAMAGDKIVMQPGSMMMVHKPWSISAGNSEDFKKAAEYLEKVEGNLVEIYVSRTGLDENRILELLEAETWMNSEEAVEMGFADEAIPAKTSFTQTVKNLAEVMSAVRPAVMQPMMSLKTKIKAEEVEAEPDVQPEPVEVPERPAPEKEAEEIEAPAEVTEEAVTEAEEPAEETNQPIVQETEMSDVDNIVKNQVLTPENQAAPAPKASDYLKTRASLEDFASVLEANAGRTAADVKDAWTNHLNVKMGITNPEVMLPDGVIQAIEDAFAEGGSIWNLVNKTNLDVFRVAADTVTGEDSRAKGHTRGTTKAEEVITLSDRVIRGQFIYKYLTLDKETVRENRSSGALLRYVLSELPRRIVREIERAIVIGDGRAAGNTKITSFVSLKADAADAATGFAATYTPAAGQSRYESLLRAKALVRADGAKYIVAKSSFLTEVLLEKGVNDGYIFAPGTDLARAFGFAGVIEPDWMEDDADNDAYIFVPSVYRTVGDTSVEAFSNFILAENKNEYLQEIYAGGALSALNSAVAIAETPAA